MTNDKPRRKLSEVMGVGSRKRRTTKKEMTKEELRKWSNWKTVMQREGVSVRDLGKAVGMAIEGRWIQPGNGNLSSDVARKRLRTNLKKHGIKTR